MYLVIALAALELCFWLIGRFDGELPRAYYQALILVVLVFVGAMAYQSLEDDEYWHIVAYIVGAAYTIEHLIHRAPTYDALADSGTVLATSVVAVAYIGLPMMVCILPFVAMVPRYRSYFRSKGWIE